jgi:release factor glutamine methyltransferase
MRKLNAIEINLLSKAGIDQYSIDLSELGDKPIEHLIEMSEFYNREFKITKNTLIPRIETEMLIEIGLKNVKEGKKLAFCDIGTGSGAIGITFGLELLERQLEFNAYLSDISDEALKITRENLQKLLPKLESSSKKNLYKVGKSKFEVFKSNLFEKYNPAIRFDFIFANLPYIPSSRLHQLPSSVKDHEPRLALDGGENGLDLILEILIQSYNKIKKNGLLLLEVDDTHDAELWNSKTFEEDREVWNNEILNDENGKNRFWILQKKQKIIAPVNK